MEQCLCTTAMARSDEDLLSNFLNVQTVHKIKYDISVAQLQALRNEHTSVVEPGEEA